MSTESPKLTCGASIWKQIRHHTLAFLRSAIGSTLVLVISTVGSSGVAASSDMVAAMASCHNP